MTTTCAKFLLTLTPLYTYRLHYTNEKDVEETVSRNMYTTSISNLQMRSNQTLTFNIPLSFVNSQTSEMMLKAHFATDFATNIKTFMFKPQNITFYELKTQKASGKFSKELCMTTSLYIKDGKLHCDGNETHTVMSVKEHGYVIVNSTLASPGIEIVFEFTIFYNGKCGELRIMYMNIQPITVKLTHKCAIHTLSLKDKTLTVNYDTNLSESLY